MKDASYSKLKDGTWGIRVEGFAEAGELVRVVKKSGDVREEILDKIIWRGHDKFGGDLTLGSTRTAAVKAAREKAADETF